MTMAQQLTLPLGRVSSQQFDPARFVQQGARRYAAGQGMQWTAQGLEHVQSDPQRRYATYRAYTHSQALGMETPEIRRSYEAMREHVNKQYEYMTRPREQGGMGISVEVTNTDPYSDPRDMARDVSANRRIKVLSSAATGGHAFFTNEENDRFRAVHDVFGHQATGRGFSRHGEEAAYLSHQQMFPKEAHAALASETRGQNAVVTTTGQFPSQEGPLVGLPPWAESTKKGEYGQPESPKPKPQGQQLRLGI